MLTSVRLYNNKKVDAEYSKKDEKPFICPLCKEEVFLRKGLVRIHHFYHKQNSNCHFGEGESENHRLCKRQILNALQKEPAAINFEIERTELKTVIPDISGRIRDIPVVIEIQNSSIDIETIKYRTREYTRRGIYLLWILIWNDRLDSEKYNPRLWERYIHDLYKGRLYYWKEDLDVIPYHFGDYYFYREPEPYYDTSGEQHYPGSYYEFSKRYVTPIKGNVVNIVEGFLPFVRNYEKTDIFEFHNSILYSDNQNIWW